jgi:phenylpropionate dioxygenase-like ring-hydroxylating dioxygenase large terminal subunit
MQGLYAQARNAGLDSNYWYAVARSQSLRRGAVREVTFWERSIALFRCADGSVGAVANSCAHRRIKLTLGEVRGSRLICPYHGWQYDKTGRLAAVPHDLFGRRTPNVCIAGYPVRERYGLVWIFPGNPARAEETPLPDFPAVEGSRPWASVGIDFVWRAHFSIIVENLLDFTHAYLHRRYGAFGDAVLTRSESGVDKVVAEYDASIGNGRISGLFVNRKRVDTTRISTYFDYPYQRASIDDKIKHWCFLTPLDLRRTQVFFTIVVDFDALRVPLTPFRMPRPCAQLFLRGARKLMIAPLIAQDGRAVEAEQEAVDTVPDARIIELNPVTGLVQKMIVERWRAYQPNGAIGGSSNAP